MATLPILLRGENRLLERSLYQSDGTSALPRSSLGELSVQLRQGGRTIRRLVLGTNDELRAGTDSNAVKLEITSAISSRCAPGLLEALWELKVTDTDFSAESAEAPVFIDRILEPLFIVS